MRISDWSSDVCSSDLPAFIAGGQDVAEHDERFLVRSGGYRMEAVVGMRNADEFRLRPVDGIAQDPPAVGTVRIHPATAIFAARAGGDAGDQDMITSLRSEEHTSELQSLMRISYAVFCLKKKTNNTKISNKDEQNIIQ